MGYTLSAPIGMRIVAEGGYGKSWSLSEIAGRFAEKYLDSDIEGDKPIPVLIDLGKMYKGCSSISQKIGQLVFKGKEDYVSDFFKQNKIILLIDAMDEAKAEIQDDVSRELAALKETYPNITLVCASRKSCIDRYPISIPCYAIKELDDNQIIDYIKKAIPEEISNREDLIEKAKSDWIGETHKEFLRKNRTPFYINCYVELVSETGDNDFVDTTQLIEKFLKSTIDREISKTGFNSDRETFLNFLINFCRLLDDGDEERGRLLALPENDVIRELTNSIVIEKGKASIKAVGDGVNLLSVDA